ncbi:MAG TPA: hypothetical protein P5234_08480 [Thermoanaerobaculaceae bacterium]|nr:hypothetical protein [Thermoanaerobaculaceae bacterium]HRS16266.1 hypothetical protein [Thermoanaerobaculaceae bacterium]
MRKALCSVVIPALAVFGVELGPHTHHPGSQTPSTVVERTCPRLPLVPHLHPSDLHLAEPCPLCAAGPAPPIAPAEAGGHIAAAPPSPAVMPAFGSGETHWSNHPSGRGPPSSCAA